MSRWVKVCVQVDFFFARKEDEKSVIAFHCES